MKKTIFLTLLACMALSFHPLRAQTGDSRTFAITGSYDAVIVSGAHTVNFAIGDQGEPITVIADPAQLEKTEIYVKNNTLHIGYKPNSNLRVTKPAQVFVKNPNLKKGTVSGSGKLLITGGMDTGSNEFTISGSGQIEVGKIECTRAEIKVSGSGSFNSGNVVAGTLSTKVSGSGRINLEGVDAASVNASVSGSGKTTLSGTATEGSYSVSGSGSIHSNDLVTVNAEARVGGSGRIHLKCTGKLDAKVSGSGYVDYYGEPERLVGAGRTKNIRKR